MLVFGDLPNVLVSETPVRQSIDDYARIIVHLIRAGETAGEWPAADNLFEIASILTGSKPGHHLMVAVPTAARLDAGHLIGCGLRHVSSWRTGQR